MNPRCLARGTEDTSGQDCRFLLASWVCGADILESLSSENLVRWEFRVQQVGTHTWTVSQSVSSVTQSCLTLCKPMDCSTPGFLVYHQLLELAQTHVHQVGDAIQPLHPLSSPSPPAFNHSQNQGLFPWASSSHQVAKILKFQLQHQPFQWIFRLISFRMDWLDLLAVQGTLKGLLQHHSSKASIFSA